ncbi:MAG: TIGR00730 family Rossman fold protein [Candidatus Limivicinus sp.]
MNICVFGASSNDLAPAYYAAAQALGRAIAAGGHALVFGGGAGGLMGACARGAAELDGAITGIAPRFFDEPGILYQDCGQLIFTDTMAQRKQLMEEKADAYIVLPGGIGTFEEFFEVLTLKQLGRHAKPMVMLNTLGYYDALVETLRKTAEAGFMSRRCLELFSLCDSPEAAVKRCSVTEENRGGIFRLSDYTR